MARRRKGRDISGWVILDKPAGLTSTQAVGTLRWAFDAKKAGHAGTLDPAATGLLAVALGAATKTIPFVMDTLKAYDFCVKFGAATNTDDAEGDVLCTSAKRPTNAEIIDALQGFIGHIKQVPPQFSAVKIDGQRAYDLARAAQHADIAPRPLYVDELTLTDRPDVDLAILRMVCAKGGYVRSIARDLGKTLGCYAHVAHLRRLWAGPFDLKKAAPLAQIEQHAKTPQIETFLLPLEAGLKDVPQGCVTAEAAAKLRHGNAAQCHCDAPQGAQIWASLNGRAIALGRHENGMIHPFKVLDIVGVAP